MIREAKGMMDGWMERKGKGMDGWMDGKGRERKGWMNGWIEGKGMHG